jgi:type VI secretion system secreted protein VgrG
MKLVQNTNAKLTLADHPDTLLVVQSVSVREEMNKPFKICVRAISDREDIDLESIVGKGFVLTMTTPNVHEDGSAKRMWSGVCATMTQLHVEAAPGKSLYELRLVPTLWRTKLRTNCRIYQHMSTPDIVGKLLTEWDIEPVWRLRSEHKKHEYIVQYNETDYAFISRMLEEAGISYYFHDNTDAHMGREIMRLVMNDAPHANEQRKATLGYTPHRAHLFGGDVDKDLCALVVLTRRMVHGRFTLRGHDFRARSDMPVHAEHAMDTERNYRATRTSGPASRGGRRRAWGTRRRPTHGARCASTTRAQRASPSCMATGTGGSATR